METGSTDQQRNSYEQLTLMNIPLKLQEVWYLSCYICSRYHVRAIGEFEARRKARKHSDKYGHNVTCWLEGTNKFLRINRKYELIDNEEIPY